jgi:hypothetical protein
MPARHSLQSRMSARVRYRDRPYEDKARQQAKADFFTTMVRILPLSALGVVTPEPAAQSADRAAAVKAPPS